MHIIWKATEVHGAPGGGLILISNHPAAHSGPHVVFLAEKYKAGSTLQCKAFDGVARALTAVIDGTGEMVWQPSDYDPHTQGPPSTSCEFMAQDWGVVELLTPDTDPDER